MLLSSSWRAFVASLLLFTCLPASLLAAELDSGSKSDSYVVYVGTYTRGDSKGIYRLEFSPEDGSLKTIGEPTEIENPSFLTLHPDGQYLYAVSEVSDYEGTKSGSITAYKIADESGQLERLNTESTRGASPCHLKVDQTGKTVVVANYSSGNVVSLPLRANGHLMPVQTLMQHVGRSVDERRQLGPHAHSVTLSSDNKFVYAADLGIDRILIYRLDPTAGTLAETVAQSVTLPPGAGPRHFALNPKMNYAYSLNELDSTVSTFSRDPETGGLELLETVSTLPEDFDGQSTTAEICVHPNAQFAYCSNRGHDSIAWFTIDPVTAALTRKGNVSTEGGTPRNFNIDPTGRYLLVANQTTDNVVVFEIDQESGEPRATGVSVKIPSPVCIKFWKTGAGAQ